MNHRILLLLCLLCGMLGYGLGLLRGDRRPDEPRVVETVDTQFNKAERRKTGDAGARNAFPVDVVQLENAGGKEELLRQVHSDDPITRMAAFAALVKDLDDESLRVLLDAYENAHVEDDLTGFMTLQLLTFAWAQEDPEGALAWAAARDESIEKGLACYSILDAWARYDSEAALAWARAHYDETDRMKNRGNELLLGVIRGISQSDLAGATALMTELNNKRQLDKAAAILVTRAWAQGEAEAMAWADSLPEGEAGDAACRAVGRQLAREDLDQAMVWVDGIGESALQVELGKDVARRVAAGDPAKAAAWVGSMPEGKTRSTCMERVVKEWVQTDPAATAEWLNQFPNDESIDGSLTIFMRGIAEQDPQSAMEWANAISDPKRRAKATRYVNSVSERAAE